MKTLRAQISKRNPVLQLQEWWWGSLTFSFCAADPSSFLWACLGLSKYTEAPGEGVQPDFLQHGAALNCCGSKYSESVEDGWKGGVHLMFCCPQPPQPTEGKQTPLSFKKKLSQGLIADGSALLADVDTFVPYSSFTTQFWTIKLSKKCSAIKT